MALQELQWQDALKLASPFPYVLGVTVDTDGKANIIGLGWWTIVSWQPPMCAISVGYPRHSYKNLVATREFTLCFPSEGLSKGAWFAGKKSGRDHDKFAETGLEKITSKIVKPPIIKGSTVAFECKVNNVVEAGDHALFIADIVAIHGDRDLKTHIYTIGYSNMFGFGSDLEIKKDLPE